MKTTQQIILETLLLEATKEVKKLVKKGKGRKEAALEVAEQMELTLDETDALISDVEAAPIADMPAPQDMSPDSNVINFKSAEEAENAAGILMYKGIGWRMKSTQPPFISFDDAAGLKDAKDALKRRWDFLENIDRTVAVIEFDNLDEYNKVLEFISRNNWVVMAADNDALTEDVMDELAAAAGKTASGRTKKINEADIVAKANAYKAVPKGYSQLDAKDFSSNNRSDRSVKVYKKWK